MQICRQINGCTQCLEWCFETCLYCTTGLTQQLNQPGVGHVTIVLEKAKSYYLKPFLTLAQQIQVSVSQLTFSIVSVITITKTPLAMHCDF